MLLLACGRPCKHSLWAVHREFHRFCGFAILRFTCLCRKPKYFPLRDYPGSGKKGATKLHLPSCEVILIASVQLFLFGAVFDTCVHRSEVRCCFQGFVSLWHRPLRRKRKPRLCSQRHSRNKQHCKHVFDRLKIKQAGEDKTCTHDYL